MQTAKYAWLILGILFTISLITLWPGVISPDAAGQYKEAIAGLYSDHHPPAMSLLWHYLDKIYPGSGLLFTFHTILLYLSAAIFVYIFRDSKFKWWYAVYPLIPNILAYTLFIVKDTSFVYSYLLAGAIMSYLIVNQQVRWKYTLLSFVFLLLTYGTATKYQAQFLLVFFTLGIAYCTDYKFKLKNIIIGVVLYAISLGLIHAFNAYLVPQQQKSHTWQLVKLYDLTAISIDLDSPMYPAFIKDAPNFSFAKVLSEFDRQKVDDVVFPADSVLFAGVNQEQREQLWNYWFTTIKAHPWLYLKNRVRLWSYNLTTVPSQNNDPAMFLQGTSFGKFFSVPIVAASINNIYTFVNNLFKFVWLLPLLIFYTYLATTRCKISREAVPLLMFCVTSLALLLILMFFAMAGVARYVFLCTALVHASHGFAYRVLVKYRHKE